ncbi:CBL-interacting serine/threonine-protein kinase 4 [Bienertia sinuspersici]
MAAAVAADPHHQAPPPTSTNPKIVLQRYILGKVLGKGSFAKVFHARSISNHKSVAIKVIDKSKTHPSMEPRIVGEVAAMHRLNHPNILKIYEVLATKSKIYLVMELAKGGDLFGKLAKRPDHRFTEPIARKYFHQLVSAIHYCHQNGVAHRDVKPQNLLLDDEGNVKVADFGLSAVADNVADKLMLQTSCGTPAFAAPEIVGRTRNGYDGAKADAWSCGVILFVMLTGYLPFDDSNLVMMFRKMHRKEFRFPSWVTKPARGLITRLLDPNPKTRLNIDEIIHDSWFKNEQKYEKIMFERNNSNSNDGVENGMMSAITTPTTPTMMNNGGGSSSARMNAFEIITMSSGLDLGGLFDQDQMKKAKRFTTSESKGMVAEKVVEIGENLGYEVEKREKCGGRSSCVWLGKGRFVFSVTVSEVAVEMIVVEMRVVDGGGVGWDQEESNWNELIKGLNDIIVVSWHK